MGGRRGREDQNTRQYRNLNLENDANENSQYLHPRAEMHVDKAQGRRTVLRPRAEAGKESQA